MPTFSFATYPRPESSPRREAITDHAFDHLETILGQGTLGLELEGQAPQTETVLAPVGGGGLLAGLAAWYGRRVRLIVAEPGGAAALAALLSGAYVAREDERIVVIISGGNTTAVDFG